jgi:hypothetical protein
MTSAEYVAACDRLGLTPTWQMPMILGFDRMTGYRYSRGISPIPRTVEVALLALVRLSECGEQPWIDNLPSR